MCKPVSAHGRHNGTNEQASERGAYSWVVTFQVWGQGHMKKAPSFNRLGALLRAGAILALLGGWMQSAPTGARAADGQATIVITTLATDGTTPIAFARYQLIDSDGNVVVTRESAPPDGIATIDVELGDSNLSYTVSMETPPACAAQPDDQDIGKLAAGDEVDLTFEVDFQNDCVLGSISAYSYLCPDGTDSTTDQYSDLQQTCTEPQNDVPFSVTEKGGDQQTFSMVTGAYGIDGRAPLVGLVPGTYSLQSDDADAGSLVVFCSTYDGTPLESSEPASIKRTKVS